jgi:hypothetical protein
VRRWLPGSGCRRYAGPRTTVTARLHGVSLLMAQTPAFNPVLQPYDVRVVASYLARAFNGSVQEVPPTASPVWPLACRMVEILRRDGYALGAFHRSEIEPRRIAPAAHRLVRPLRGIEDVEFRPAPVVAAVGD